MSSGSSSGMKWPASIALPSTAPDALRAPERERIEAGGRRGRACPRAASRSQPIFSPAARDARSCSRSIDGAGAVVLAGGVDRVGAAEAALVLGERLGLDVAEAVRAPAAERPAQVEAPGRRRSSARAAAPAGSGRTSGSSRSRRACRRARTCRASARCRSAPAARPAPRWSSASRCATRPPRSWPATKKRSWPRPLISAAMSAAIARLLCSAWSASGVAAGPGLVESP